MKPPPWDQNQPASPSGSIEAGVEGRILFSADARLAEKVARAGFEAKVVREAEWILGLPLELRARFPRVVRIDRARGSYTMEALPADNVGAMLLQNRIDAGAAAAYWTQAFSAFFQFGTDDSTPPSPEWAHGLVEKANARIAALRRLNDEFDRLCSSASLTIDDVEHHNAPEVLARIGALASGAPNILLPPRLMVMHLDLQLSNILASGEGVLIDSLSLRNRVSW